MDTVFKDYFALDKFNNAKMPYVLMVFSGKYLGSREKYFVNPVFKGEEKEEKRKKKYHFQNALKTCWEDK